MEVTVFEKEGQNKNWNIRKSRQIANSSPGQTFLLLYYKCWKSQVYNGNTSRPSLNVIYIK